MTRTFAILILVLALTACSGKPALQEIAGGVTIEVPIEDIDSYIPDTISMGAMNEGQVIKAEVTLHNTGGQPVVIVSVITGCGCTTAKYDKNPILPDDRRSIEFQFDSKGRSGPQRKVIEILTSGNVAIPVMLTGEVRRK